MEKNLYQNDFLAKATFPHISYIFSEKLSSLVLSPAIKFSEALTIIKVCTWYLWFKVSMGENIAADCHSSEEMEAEKTFSIFNGCFYVHISPFKLSAMISMQQIGYFLLTTLDWIRTFFLSGLKDGNSEFAWCIETIGREREFCCRKVIGHVSYGKSYCCSKVLTEDP